ncbi:MAG: hypothetical protein P4L99_17715 [Chthoniobacter sp.]|nr:hypothetical protein [Chthoniobacter sp.]
MERVELLIVEHTYQIRPGMLLISPALPVPWDNKGHGWRNRTEQVGVVRPDGRELEATAQINMTHLNIRDPNVPAQARWVVTMWLTDRTSEDVPVGSKMLVSPEVRNALFPKTGGDTVDEHA